MITANPADPLDREAVFIAAKQGLGFRVVEGHELPQQVLYHADPERVEVLNESQDGTRVVFAPGGGVASRAATPGRPVLDERLARELGRAALSIEKLFGTPQDIEWLTVGGKVVIVQARPYVKDGPITH
jgi:phosphoenolpyruvate synthase/pyruvate phosphate dikinase